MVKNHGEQQQKEQQQQHHSNSQSSAPTPILMASSNLPLGQQAQWLWKVAAKERSFGQKRGSGGSNSSDGGSARGLNWWASREGSREGSMRGSKNGGKEAARGGGEGLVVDKSRLGISNFNAGSGGASSGATKSEGISAVSSALPVAVSTSQKVATAAGAKGHVSGFRQSQMAGGGNAGVQSAVGMIQGSTSSGNEKRKSSLWMGFGFWKRNEVKKESGEEEERGPELQFLEANRQNCKPHGPRHTE